MEEILKAIALGIVEGLTEFLPVSSTGHLILATEWLNFPTTETLRNLFQIFIQFGALLAILWYYRADFIQQIRTVRTDKKVQNFGCG